MAKISAIQKEKKRQYLCEHYREYREGIKRRLKKEDLTNAERFELVNILAKLPRNSSPSRLHNRCQITGRPHGYLRMFGLSRIKVRELASMGMLPGVHKASW
ncbi:MAG: 30S ribosomal protein S14 [Anaplasmataceae bacterium]|nr:30S ribosomal protein S14 [Anaplasmataceae bacterium]